MRIVTRDEFLQLPEGAVFCKLGYANGVLPGPLCVKGETLASDDFTLRVLSDIESESTGDWSARMQAMLSGPVSHPLNREYTRDGCFSSNDRFLVYEREDVVALVQALLPASVTLQLVEVEGR